MKDKIMTIKEMVQKRHNDGWELDLTHQNTVTGSVAMVWDSPKRDHTFQVVVYRLPIDNKEWVEEVKYEGPEADVAMSFFNSYLNSSVVDPLDGMKFKCSSCGHDRLECCQEGYHLSPILCIDESGDFDYGNLESHGDVTRFQCEACGFTLKKHNIDISNNEEVVEWLKEHQDDSK
jgi:predicted RNA-binding Zn-ribbon protein involved in translation (DUF1610 family)